VRLYSRLGHKPSSCPNWVQGKQINEKCDVFHYNNVNYRGYLMYYITCFCAYFYLTGFAHCHGVLYGGGGPYAFVFFLVCSRSSFHLFTSPFIHSYNLPFFAFICAIALPYPVVHSHSYTPCPPSQLYTLCGLFVHTQALSYALVRTTQGPLYEQMNP